MGIGSGHGKTSTKGHKGQNARSGVSQRAGWEGGQNPLYRRLPKRGFNNMEFATRYVAVNVDKLAALGLKEITPEALRANGMVKKKGTLLKILAHGEIKQALVVKAHAFSGSAKEKIEKAGGQAIVL